MSTAFIMLHPQIPYNAEAYFLLPSSPPPESSLHPHHPNLPREVMKTTIGKYTSSGSCLALKPNSCCSFTHCASVTLVCHFLDITKMLPAEN